MTRAFRPPRPNFLLMWALGFINHWFLLLGIPLLRRILVVRDLPFVRGHFRIRSIDLPTADRERLASAVNPHTAAFVGPNHPEFGFDWIMDKYIMTLTAPRMASWASHGIVATAPWFWLRNNLISHNGGKAAADFSVTWARHGDGVLLHPEGTVHWTGDLVHPLFHGIADMATEAAGRTGGAANDRPVFIVPLVWKLRFVDDASPGMHREMDYIERHLELPPAGHLGISERFRALQEGILRKQMLADAFDPESVVGLDFFARQEGFRSRLVADLESRYMVEPTDSIDRKITRLQRVISTALRELRDTESAVAPNQRALLVRDLDTAEEASRLGGFIRDVYATPTLSQEQIAESLKRHRATLVTGGLRNTLHNFLPKPYGARVAHVRVPEPILVEPARAMGDPGERHVYVAELIDMARRRMQAALDSINREIGPEVERFSHPNPFGPGPKGVAARCGTKELTDRAPAH